MDSSVKFVGAIVAGAVVSVGLGLLLNITAAEINPAYAPYVVRWGWFLVLCGFTGYVAHTASLHKRLTEWWPTARYRAAWLACIGIVLFGYLFGAYWGVNKLWDKVGIHHIVTVPAPAPTLVLNKPKLNEPTSVGNAAAQPSDPPALKASPPKQSVRIPKPASKPDAVLRFSDATEPSVSVYNSGTALLREARYSFGLFDLDNARFDNKGSVPVLRTYSPTFKDYDWLKPQTGFGSYRLFEDAFKPPPSTRIFGWGSCTCPSCETERNYLVYLVFSKEGWFYELPRGQGPNWDFIKLLIGRSKEEQEGIIDKSIPPSVRTHL
jgi:hypothetical protein